MQIIVPSIIEGNAGFTTTLSGDALPEPHFGLTQVHSSTIVTVSADDTPDAVGRVEADGLVTSCPSTCLTIRVADCVPVLIAAPHHRAVAAVHAGWRGLASEIIAAGVEKLCEMASCAPADLRGVAGPAAGPCHYEVDAPTGDKIASPSPEGVLSATYGDDKVKADLWRAALNQLQAAGLPPGNVEALRICTVCHPWLLHSYRRSGPRAGRQFGFIATADGA